MTEETSVIVDNNETIVLGPIISSTQVDDLPFSDKQKLAVLKLLKVDKKPSVAEIVFSGAATVIGKTVRSTLGDETRDAVLVLIDSKTKKAVSVISGKVDVRNGLLQGLLQKTGVLSSGDFSITGPDKTH
jgi:hypothetical protein